MEQVVNEIYESLFSRKKSIRYMIFMGGRGGGRSTVASQFALAKLIDIAVYFRCAIMRYVFGDIRNSIYREIIDRAEEQEALNSLDVSEGSMVIRYGTNSINAVGFRKSSSDQKSKLKSLANYNTIIIEEADEIPEEDFMQLDDSIRTMKGDILIILLLNPPPRSSWIIKRWFNLKPHPEVKGFYIPVLKEEAKADVLFINANYRDNIKNISDQSIKNYEQYRETKPAHFWNIVEGLVPEVLRGKIYTNWKEIDEVPHEARLVARGLDFGYHPDPCALTDIYFYNGGYIFDELVYQTNLSNRQLGTIILNQPEKILVIADNAEPKSIAELKEMGIDIIPCEKGVDSVRFGIKKLQNLKISYTKRSKNIKRESEEYHWLIDKEGNEHEKPDPKCDDHGMDSVRYPFSIILPDDPEIEKTRKVEVEKRKQEHKVTVQRDVGL